MNKKLNNNFSLRKLLLTALVSGPLATLPAPLWALPDVTVANLTTTAGVTTQIVGNTLNVTSPDKAVLTWQAFGSVGTGSITDSRIGANDIINYFLPTASGSVLNAVSGGVPSTISGQILSNGNVYILNPAGIVISPTAQINVGGFYASTVNEPSGFFAINGTLSYAGTANGNVTVEGTGVNAGPSRDTAQIQAVGTGNNIYLAGAAVDVKGGKFFGNLFVRASDATGGGSLGGNNVRFGETGPVSINLVGSPLAGGGLNITSNGGNVKLTGGTQAVLSASATPVASLSSIASPSADKSGTGYQIPPEVTIAPALVGGPGSAAGPGTGATATAILNAAGTITGYTITNAGSGYTTAPTVTVTQTNGTTLVSTTGTANLTGDFLSSITALGTQTGYALAPTVLISGGGGSGATATVNVNTSGGISGYTITNSGSGYATAPTLSLPAVGAPGGPATGGTKAIAAATAVTLDTKTSGANVVPVGGNGGSGYTTAPTVTITPARLSTGLAGVGSGAIATATINSSGVVDSFGLVAAGSGYTTAPTVTVSAPTNGSLILAPNVTTTKGAFSIDTNGNGVQGNITQGGSPITASTSGQTLALNAGVGGNIILGAIDANTLGATGNNISITDISGDLTLNAITAAGTLAVAGAGNILQGAGTHSITSAITLTPAASKTVSFTGAGDLTFTSIGSTSIVPSSITVSTPGNITFNQANLATTEPLAITSSGGTITAGGITAGKALTINAGRLVASSITGATGNVTVTGNISGSGAGTTAVSTSDKLAITSSSGNLVLGTVASTTSLTLTASTGTISTAAIGSGVLTVSAPAGSFTATGTLTNSGTSSISAPTVSLAGITATGALTVTATTGNLSVAGAISATKALTLTATTGTIATQKITSTSNDTVSLSSGGSLNLGGGASTISADNSAVNVKNLSLTSTAGSITQPSLGVITSSGTVTINSFADTTLNTATNDFTNVVLKGGAGGNTGIQVTDKNAINIAGGTTALGNVTVTAGAGIASFGTGTDTGVTITDHLVQPTSVATVASGSVTALSVAIKGAGLVSAPVVTIAAPVNNAFTTGLARATATAVIDTLTGVVTGYTITNPGSGYTSAPVVTVGSATLAPGNGYGTLTTLTGKLTSGVLTRVEVVTPGTAPYATAPGLTITSGADKGATVTPSVTSGVLSVTPSQSGSITLGSGPLDVLSFDKNLTLTTSGLAGGTTYTGLTTPANSVTVLGNVSLNGKGTAFNLGNTTFGTTANYSFGQISGDLFTGNTTGGALTIIENQTVNLGALNVGSLDARSVSGDIVNTGKLAVAGTTLVAANSIFNPGDVSLNFPTNALGGVVSIGNARDFTLTNTVATTVTAGSPLVNGKAATGAVNVTVTGTGALLLNTAAGGDYNTVGFNTAASTVRIDDTSGITLQNANSTGTTVIVNAIGPIVLGSGIALNNSGTTTITSTGTTASITDSAPGIRIVGGVSLVSDGQIAITQAGHSLGAVSLETTGVSGSTSANITYTEGGTANLNVVKVNTLFQATAGGVLNVVSTGGSIIQTPGTGSIAIATSANVAAGSATFSSVGDVTLNNPATANNIAGPIAISAVGNTSIAQAQNIILGNTSVSAGTFSADSSSGLTKTITQAPGTTAKINGASTFTTQRGAITLTNIDGTGNNFGAVSARTTFNTGVEVAGSLGADIAITEAGTLNFAQVKAGTTGKLTAISNFGDIIQTTTGGVVVGGATALTSSSNVNLNFVFAANTFGGINGIAITAPGNVSLQDANGTTALAGGTTIGGTLTLKNTAVGGTIRDLPGAIGVMGDAWFETGTTGSVSIGSSSISLGAIKFNSGTVSIVENSTLNLAPGSVASGAVSLTSSGDIITSGAGGGSFQSTLTLNATGAITITNPILVMGVGTTGLVFRALGAVNLGALSLAGNLNGLAPTNLGSSTYKPPAP